MEDSKIFMRSIIRKKKNFKKVKPKKSNFNLLISTIIIIILSFILFIILLKNIIFKKGLDNNNINNYNNNNSKTNISEKIKLLKQMTNNDVSEYSGIKNCLEGDPDQLKCIYHLINTKGVVGKKKVLIGEKKDGCYLLLDDFENIKIAYSFGISNYNSI